MDVDAVMSRVTAKGTTITKTSTTRPSNRPWGVL
jgi:hypothetical protein